MAAGSQGSGVFEDIDGVVLITGAGSGMGRAASNLLSGSKARLALFDLDEAAVQETVATAALPADRVLIRRVDVADRAAVREAVGAVVSEWQAVDLVLHFAGILDATPLEAIDEDTWARVLDVNLAGSFWVAQAAASFMTQRGRGSIVLTASDSARAGSTVSGPAYATSKGGVISLVRNLALLLGPKGVRVNAVCPGLADTPMSRGWSPAVVEAYANRTPLRRLARAQEIASAAICLGSDAMSYVAGEVLEVNGGAYFD